MAPILVHGRGSIPNGFRGSVEIGRGSAVLILMALILQMGCLVPFLECMKNHLFFRPLGHLPPSPTSFFVTNPSGWLWTESAGECMIVDETRFVGKRILSYDTKEMTLPCWAFG